MASAMVPPPMNAILVPRCAIRRIVRLHAPEVLHFPYVALGRGDFSCPGGLSLFAVVRSGGKQYRVEEGALITVASVPGDPGSTVTLGEVLMVADGDEVRAPGSASVTAEIVEHGKGEKITVFRYKNKTRARKTMGSRAKSTTLRITKIEV